MRRQDRAREFVLTGCPRLLLPPTLFRRARNQRDLRRQLRGPTLGDADPAEASGSADPENTAKWLKQAQKRAKENAARRAREEEEQEAAVRATYGEADLAGLRVAHDVDDFDLQAGEEGKVLTLRDSRILDGGEDELMDAELEQRELDRINDERKKGPKQYTGLDDDEVESAAYGRKKGVLSKYDADIPGSGMRESDGGGFTLGGPSETSAERKESKRREMEEEARRKNRTLLNLDYTSEYSPSSLCPCLSLTSPFCPTCRKPRGLRLSCTRRCWLQEIEGEFQWILRLCEEESTELNNGYSGCPLFLTHRFLFFFSYLVTGL